MQSNPKIVKNDIIQQYAGEISATHCMHRDKQPYSEASHEPIKAITIELPLKKTNFEDYIG